MNKKDFFLMNTKIVLWFCLSMLPFLTIITTLILSAITFTTAVSSELGFILPVVIFAGGVAYHILRTFIPFVNRDDVSIFDIKKLYQRIYCSIAISTFFKKFILLSPNHMISFTKDDKKQKFPEYIRTVNISHHSETILHRLAHIYGGIFTESDIKNAQFMPTAEPFQRAWLFRTREHHLKSWDYDNVLFKFLNEGLMQKQEQQENNIPFRTPWGWQSKRSAYHKIDEDLFDYGLCVRTIKKALRQKCVIVDTSKAPQYYN